MMNRENEEQKPIAQTLCGAIQKEANCKCLVLSVLIYGCLAAVTWCRCANVTKIVINFSKFPIKSTKHVSPCDDGYIYIPVAFMGMLYLVYLVECYHSPIRIDLLHAEGQGGALAKLTQLRLAQPTIWWKAISYHYVRRKRQIMRYRNGDNFTTTQVYYERVNSHAATSFYFYDYCGSKDISKELILDPKIPITKITLSKGFAFSNVRSATEFEEARSRFFAEQEFRDDYMEMREGLDLGCNFSPMTLVAVLGNPWFTRSYVYWCLSALLLSWPLRIIIECNTQYVDYQVTKLFGVNYDTPTNIQIHTSASQLSAPGSYMLAPSYSEALLMEPAVHPGSSRATTSSEPGESDMVPSYSEALLYERAAAEHQPAFAEQQRLSEPSSIACDCPCHGLAENARTGPEDLLSLESLQMNDAWRPSPLDKGEEQEQEVEVEMAAMQEMEGNEVAGASSAAAVSRRPRLTISQHRPTAPSRGCARICESCLNDAERRGPQEATTDLQHRRRRCAITRDYSEPDLRHSAEMLASWSFTRGNGRSLESIVENEETENPLSARSIPSRVEVENDNRQQGRSTGAIPKRGPTEPDKQQGSSSRVTVNPIAEAVKRLPNSRSTYFCLKSILKNNRRRFTLVTPEELQSLTDAAEPSTADEDRCACDGCRSELERPGSLRIGKRQRPNSCQSLSFRIENSRTLIFASPIQMVCPSDPFGGRNVVQSENLPNYEEALNMPVLSRLRRSLTDRDSSTSSSATAATSPTSSSQANRAWKHRRTRSTDPQFLASFSLRSRSSTNNQTSRTETTISLPSYDGLTVPVDSRSTASHSTDERCPFLRLDELSTRSSTSSTEHEVAAATVTVVAATHGTTEGVKTMSRLTRSLTERRSTPGSRRHDRELRKSCTDRIDTGCRIAGVRRSNINIETSL
ncbi:PREDICTED: uncharacterized protein LOC105368147 [Ceratosolen solmsi marchali]|uniref:Uncharacterized protein LOC105368147 n=1 Tax=Ceratosolen solmsi marchali TaxID=326594 RepID=A0AAJ7E2G5_9HYME|nr:PREDICTED: uncharacterized protein LOC105368147 [Ceratosolen solmsi marchali]